jgi:hypothetical protein
MWAHMWANYVPSDQLLHIAYIISDSNALALVVKVAVAKRSCCLIFLIC